MRIESGVVPPFSNQIPRQAHNELIAAVQSKPAGVLIRVPVEDLTGKDMNYKRVYVRQRCGQRGIRIETRAADGYLYIACEAGADGR